MDYGKMVPPHSVEIEQSVLAAALIDGGARQDIVDLLEGADFYKRAHQKVFRAVAVMTKGGEVVDAVTLTEFLRSEEELESVGGAVFVAKLLDEPVPPSVEVYADKLKRYRRLRDVMAVCSRALGECGKGKVDRFDEILAEFQTAALQVGYTGRRSWVTKAELTEKSLERYQELNEGAVGAAIKTGFRSIDRTTGGGFRGPKLVIIAARPGVGKTALMCNMAENMSNAGHSVGVFSLEMPKEDLDDRWIASGARVNSMRLTSEPGPNYQEWLRINDAAGVQSEWPLLIDDTPADIRELCRRVKAMVKHGVEIVFIDQLSGVTGNRHKSSYDRNTEHVEVLKFLKKEVGVPIVLLAQLNRELEKRNNKKPVLSDLKHTGQLEEDADIVLFGFRPSLYANNGDISECGEVPDLDVGADGCGVDADAAEWEIAKNRQGATRNVLMDWYGKYQKFIEI